MKILATFDGTTYSEAIMPQLQQIAHLPNAEFSLLSVAHEPNGQLSKRGMPRPIVVSDAMGRGTPMVVDSVANTYAEDKTQAITRRISELEDYLTGLAHQFPAGTACQVEAHVSGNAAEVIVDRAREVQADMIVMATHSRSGIVQVFFGSTAEQVVRSGVAPVLLVHPKE
jgi:nucleotide-binding universal stress UspA family protein